jgi:20S proteasome subunit alpha 3
MKAPGASLHTACSSHAI